MKELKPCPFCGADASLLETIEDHWEVCCENNECHIQPTTPLFCCGGRGEEAIKLWNYRHKDGATK